MAISIDQLKLVEIKIGEIKSAEKVEKADKLLKLSVDFGDKVLPESVVSAPVASSVTSEVIESVITPVSEVKTVERDIRQIISGIALHFPDPSALIGVKCAFVTNLEPRTIRGLESNGMILATGGSDGEAFTLLCAHPDTKPGSLIR
jgi:methionyl-tRNA synthetase